MATVQRRPLTRQSAITSVACAFDLGISFVSPPQPGHHVDLGAHRPSVLSLHPLRQLRPPPRHQPGHHVDLGAHSSHRPSVLSLHPFRPIRPPPRPRPRPRPCIAVRIAVGIDHIAVPINIALAVGIAARVIGINFRPHDRFFGLASFAGVAIRSASAPDTITSDSVLPPRPSSSPGRLHRTRTATAAFTQPPSRHRRHWPGPPRSAMRTTFRSPR